MFINALTPMNITGLEPSIGAVQGDIKHCVIHIQLD
jgi:hypothetical protein